MKRAINLLISILTSGATAVFASSAAPEAAGGYGMLIWFFIGFGALLLLFQTTPALMMFASLIKGLFSSDPEKASFSPFKGKNDR